METAEKTKRKEKKRTFLSTVLNVFNVFHSFFPARGSPFSLHPFLFFAVAVTLTPSPRPG